MPWLHLTFWLAASCVIYTYAVYPALVALMAGLRGRPVRRQAGFKMSVSVVIAARNEEATIGRRIEEFLQMICSAQLAGEIVVVSDGSTDGTVAAARAHECPGVRVLELETNVGKAAALSRACALAENDILVLADTRQLWAPNTLSLLLENFADPEVGAVSGELIMETRPGALAGVGFYWRYEKWLRRLESRWHSMVGATGAVSAVRRSLFQPIPEGILLDDVYWPLQVVMGKHRVIHDDRACAFDRLPDRVCDEFRRKVRTLSGNFQLVFRLPAALVPWRSPIWFQLVSHKLMRLLVPWALIAMFVVSAVVHQPIYEHVFWSQIVFCGLGLAGTWKHAARHFRPASAAASFLVLNTAAYLAFWVWVLGRSTRSWGPVRYRLDAR
jgi:cellulose synthase/poly-beta-1,6-N-acetylglucosamine synthase-like glycosyltransferase